MTERNKSVIAYCMQGPKYNIIYGKLKFTIANVIEDSSLPVWGGFLHPLVFKATEGLKTCKVAKRKDTSKKLKIITIIMTIKNIKYNVK